MKTRRALIAGAAAVVATGGALVAFTPAGAQDASEPTGADTEAPNVVTVQATDGAGEPIEISPECMALLDLERGILAIEGEFDDFDELDEGDFELSEADRAEAAEFAAVLAAHLDAAGVAYETYTEEGIDFPEPVDDAGWQVADEFAESYFEEKFGDLEDIDFEDGDFEDGDLQLIDELPELPQDLIDQLNAEDEALREHLDGLGVEYVTETDESGVMFSMPVNDADWDKVDAFYDARYGDCEDVLEAEFGPLEDCDEGHEDDDDEGIDDEDVEEDDEPAEAAAA